MNAIMELIVKNIKENGLSKKDEVAKFLLEKKISLMFFPELEILFPNNLVSEHYKICYENRIRQVTIQRSELKSIDAVLKSKKIEFMVVKGMPLSQILVSNPFARECSDIDILVKKEDMFKCYKELSLYGYRFLEGLDEYGKPIISNKPDYLYADDYHEFPCIKIHNDNIYTIIEIKYTTSAIPYKYINKFWEDSIVINLGNVAVRTFSITDSLIHIIAHLYVNSQCVDGYVSVKFFRDFVDLKIFLDKYTGIEWDFVLQKVYEYEMIHQVFFAFNSINFIWPNTISTDIIKKFSLDKIVYTCKCNENGEMLNWKSDIRTRCFDENLRLREYALLYKENLFNQNRCRNILVPGVCKKLLIQGNVEYFIVASFNSISKQVNLLLVYNEKLFREKNIYFIISIIDGDRNQKLVTRNVSNPDKIKWNNLLGQWNSYEYDGKGFEWINIDIANILLDGCKEICVLIDSYKKIGTIGFKGTGANGDIIISV